MQSNRIGVAVTVLVFLALSGMVLSVPLQLPGDGHEYISTVASLLHSGNMKFEPEDLENAARENDPETFFVYGPHGQNTKINPWTNERVWGSHSFYISLLGLPFVILFKAKGFLVLNALFFSLLLWYVYRHLRDFNSDAMAAALAATLTLLSGATSYVFWVNSEVILMGAIAAAFYYGLRFRVVPAALFLALATVIKPPMLLAFFPLALWHFVHKRSLRSIVLMVAVYACAGAPHLIYDLVQFGRFGTLRIAGESAGGLSKGVGGRILGFATLERFSAFWLQPGTGMVWFYPGIIWCLVRNRLPWWMFGAVGGAAVAISVLCLIPLNFFSTEAGVRYATLIFPLFLMLPGTFKARWPDWVALTLTAFLGGSMLMDAAHNTRDPQQIFAKNYPSMSLVRGGVTYLYPEILFHCGWRMPRDVAADFIDSDSFIRDTSVQVMLRNVDAADTPIVQLYNPRDAKPVTITYEAEGGSRQRIEAGPGAVATLLFPLDQARVMHTAYPDWRMREYEEAGTVRTLLRFSDLSVRRGKGELRWQQRYHGSVEAFLYPAGPYVMNVYPDTRWIISSLASETLPGTGPTDLESAFVLNRPGARATLETSDFREGTHALRYAAEPGEDPAPHVLLEREARPLIPVRPGMSTVEVQGLAKVDALVRSGDRMTAASIILFWFDEAGREIKTDWAWATEQRQPWRMVRNQVPVPEGAAAVRVALAFSHGSGDMTVDNIVLSWFQDMWWIPPLAE